MNIVSAGDIILEEATSKLRWMDAFGERILQQQWKIMRYVDASLLSEIILEWRDVPDARSHPRSLRQRTRIHAEIERGEVMNSLDATPEAVDHEVKTE